MSTNHDQLIALRNGKEVPQRSGEYWTEEEQKKLQQLFWNGYGISHLALEFKRTEIAIYQQLDKAGLLACQCRSRSRKPKKQSEPQCACLNCAVADCQNRGKERPYVGSI